MSDEPSAEPRPVFAGRAVGAGQVPHVSLTYLLVILPTILWSSNVVVARAVIATTPPVALTFWRWAGGILVLLPFALPKLIAERRVLARCWKDIALVGVLGVAGFTTLVYIAVRSTTAINATLIQGCIPLAVICTSRVLYGQRISAATALGTGLAFCGLLLVVSGGDPLALLAIRFNIGDLILSGAIWLWALYIVLLKRIPPQLSQLASMLAIAIVGEAVIGTIYLSGMAGPRWFEPSLGRLAAIAYIAVFPTAVAYHLWNKGIAAVGANAAAQSQYLLPVFGVAFSVVFLGESVRWFHLVSAMLIIAGIYLSLQNTRS